MFCTNCGKRIIDTARFCNYCGEKIVEIDENKGRVSNNITENPASSASENVINTENVENSGNLLKMTASVPSYIPKMNESPKSGYSPDSVPVSVPASAPADVQSGAVGIQQSPLTSETGVPITGDNAEATAPSVLPETGTAPAYPDPAPDPYATPAASVSPETGAPDPYATPAASVSPEMGAPDPYATPAASSLPEMAATAAAPGSELYAAPAVLPKEEAPRKYTLGHLIMCLAASGVMAIAAGIFAGLYFSVV